MDSYRISHISLLGDVNYELAKDERPLWSFEIFEVSNVEKIGIFLQRYAIAIKVLKKVGR